MRIPKCYYCDKNGVDMTTGESTDGGDSIPIIAVCDDHKKTKKDEVKLKWI